MDDDDTPVLDTMLAINAVSIERCGLDPREMMLARIAALIAVGAPATSYLGHAATAAEVGITLDDVEGVLIAVAPIAGTPNVGRAVGNLAKALGFTTELAAQLEAELGG